MWQGVGDKISRGLSLQPLERGDRLPVSDRSTPYSAVTPASLKITGSA